MKRMNLDKSQQTDATPVPPALISREDVQEVPEVDVLLGFAKPSLVAAGLRCCDDRIELYYSLDGPIHLFYVERETCKHPSEAIQFMLEHLGIERGEAGDGVDMEGKIVDLTERSMAVSLTEAWPAIQVVTGQTLFDFDGIAEFVASYYPGDMWNK